MSNTTLLLDDLSFGGIRSSLRTFMRSQDIFADYDFDGSNLSTLLDVLAYNTQQNGYMLNMVFNEGFLDTAETFDALVSHAKELNYTPRSATSASITANVTITPVANTPSFIIIPANTVFNATASNAALNFRTVDPYIAYPANSDLNTYTVSNVIAYEGTSITEVYTIDWSDLTQEFTINNANADTSSLRVTIQNNGANTTYVRATSLLDYDENSLIFFVESTFDQKYKVLFGDNVIGKKPENGSTLYINYRIPKGIQGNGVSRLTSGSIDGHANVVVSVVSTSAGGAARETMDSIKYYAPRYFQARDRAVTTSDYETLLQSNFPEIAAINVYGGDEMSPPQFGKVAISIDLTDADGVSEGREQIYYNFLRKRCPVTVEPIFIDPDFLNIRVNTTVNFDPAVSQITSTQLIANVTTAISSFNNTNLQDFNTTLYLSKLMEAINDVDTSIRSNQTRLFMTRTIDIASNASTYSTTFHNAVDEGSLSSTSFVYDTDTCYFDDSNGSIRLFTYVANVATIIDANVGTIDYSTGEIDINSISITSTSGAFTLTTTPTNQDISSRQNTIIQIDMDALSVSTTTS